jgi:hypothetical protein
MGAKDRAAGALALVLRVIAESSWTDHGRREVADTTSLPMSISFETALASVTLVPRRKASPDQVKAALPALVAAFEVERAYARSPRMMTDLIRQIRSGDLVALRKQRRRVVQELEGVEVLGPMSEKAPEEELTWVSIELLDQDGAPMAFERFVVIAGNGVTREGRLDVRGRAKVDGLVPGDCKVTFPALDAREWSEAA